MRALMHFIDEMPAAAVRVPTFNLAFLPRFAAMSEEEFVVFANSKPLRKEFMLAMGRKGFPQKDMDAALDRLNRTYARMDREIAQSGGPWLLGAAPTLADVAVMPAIVRVADLGMAGMWNDKPRVTRWFDSIRAHPAFKPTYYSGSLLTERFPHLKGRAAAPDVACSCRAQPSYLNESATRVRKAVTLPFSTLMSIFVTSATRRSRSEPAAVSTALRPASTTSR